MASPRGRSTRSLGLTETPLSKRPASVTSAIVVLSMMVLVALMAAVLPSGASGQPHSWLAAGLLALVFAIPLYALTRRMAWGRLYVTVLFTLIAVGLLYTNITNAASSARGLAIGYAVLISGLLAWNIRSLWSEGVTSYFRDRAPSP